MKKLLLLILIILSFPFLKVQAQWGNIWVHPANNFRMDFNSGVPVITMPSVSGSSVEGYSSICDDNGQLLFYASGVKVYDRNMNLMPNGDSIGGGVSSSQGLVIFPKPGSTHEFYLFTVDQNPASVNSTNGLCWSIVDLNLNSGLGEVVSKANFLLDSCYEKISATRHCNGVDWWVVVHPWNSNEFVSFLIDQSGVNNNPQISAIGPIISDTPNNFGNSLGMMKISPEGRFIGLVNSLTDVSVYKFNNETGEVFDTVFFETTSMDSLTLKYACAFSPNGKYFYSQSNLAQRDIYQYDLTLSTQDSVLNSKIGLFNAPFGTSLITNNVCSSLGPDGKLYFVTNDTLGVNGYCALSVVNKPNLPGLDCEMVPSQHILSGANFIALPNFPDCIFAREHKATLHIPTCTGADSAIVVFDTLLNVVHDISWDFGDPASGVNNTYEGTDPFHLFSAPGTYTITLTFTNRCNQFIISRDVYIPNTTPPLVPTIVLNASFLEASVSPNYQWYLNDSLILAANNFAFAPTQNGIYTVSTTQNGCTVFSLPFLLTAVSIEEIKRNQSFTLFQNKETLTLQCNPLTDCFYSLELIDLQGRVLQTHFYQQKQNNVNINISELQSGIYLLRVNGREVRRIINH
jgi:hypothetical protein